MKWLELFVALQQFKLFQAARHLAGVTLTPQCSLSLPNTHSYSEHGPKIIYKQINKEQYAQIAEPWLARAAPTHTRQSAVVFGRGHVARKPPRGQENVLRGS